MAVSFPSAAQITGPHTATYDAYWIQADAKKGGVLGAPDAATYLKKSGLNAKVLSQVWDLSDPSGKGYLDKTGFTVALKLIALAQTRQDLNVASLTKETSPPNLGPVELQMAASAGDWAIPATELIKYDQIFTGLHPNNGKLTGDQVKPVFLNSKLPVEVLGRVWDLSDVDKDGMLDKEEFAVAMHLVYRALEKDPVPMTLSPALIPPSKRSLGGAVPHGLDLANTNTPAATSPTLPWVVSPAEKAKFDEMFKSADLANNGFVNGVEIKDIFLQSGLPENVLATIWNLCDNKALGKLNSEQFALAMYLIQQKLKGVEPPDSLTPEMVPPSMRPVASGTVSMVTDFNTQGMQELEIIQKQIDDIKRHKLQFEQEKAQKMADIKIRNGEVQGLQKELDVINGTATKLENQKGEAQKKLDELDDRKSNLDADVKDMQDKCSDEQKEIDRLTGLIDRSQSTVKDQEEQLTAMRDDLNALRRTELELEQKVETGRTQLNDLLSNISQTHGKVTQSEAVVVALEADRDILTGAVDAYENLVQGVQGATEPDLSGLTGGKVPDEPSAQNGVAVNGLTNGSAGGRASTDAFEEDPFKQDDPFKNKPPRPPMFVAHRDPFKSSDPFGSEDPFGGAFGGKTDKSIKTTTASFGDLDVLTGSKPKGDPFGGSDPFGGAFSSNNLSAAKDPFAPFAGATDLTSPVNPSDPFGTDPFIPGGKNKPPPPRPSKSPAPGQREKSPAPPVPSLPPKQKKAPAPPRPPAPKPSTKSPSHTASPMPADDPFGGFDPFGSSVPSAPSAPKHKSQSADIFGGGAFADFNNFGGSGAGTDAQWSSQPDELDEWQRIKHKQEQEQADYELALKLQQQESPA